MKKYTAYVINEQGATDTIQGGRNTNKKEILQYARATYGSGWRVIIKDIHDVTVIDNTLR